MKAQINQYAWDWVIELNEKDLLHGDISSINYTSKTFGTSDTNTISESAFYNDKTKLTNSIRYAKEGRGGYEHSTFRVYSSDDTTCILQYHIQQGDTASVYKFEYDILGRMLKANLYKWNEYYSTFNFLYNSDGLMKECFVLFAKNNDTSRTIYSYNKAGKMLSKNNYHGDILYKSIKWKYNKLGNLVECSYTRPENPDDSYTEVYSNGEFGQKKSSKRTDSNGLFVMHAIYTYNYLGNIETETLMNDSEDTLVQFFKEYEYDNYNNWINCITTANDTLYQIQVREIKYRENNH